MDIDALYRRDLNLFIALKILIEEGSVSRSALRLNVSQSAMSRILGRLRILLDDPLFVRQGLHLQPTMRALEISQALNQPLDSLCALLSPTHFDAKKCGQHFVIATTDYAMQTILPFALPRIYAEAPNISLDFKPLKHEQILHQLTREGCDMAICRPPKDIKPLLHDDLGLVSVFCMLSKSHPLAKKELQLSDYLTYPHALIAISDGVKSLLEDALREHGNIKILLRAYHLQAALAIVDKMPLIITVPADLAYLVAAQHNLVIKVLPFNFKPFSYSLIWHPRSENMPAQRWLRNLLKEQCACLIDKRVADMHL